MSLTPNEAYAAKQPFVDKETLEHIVEQFPTPFHLYDETGIRRNMQEVRDAFAWNPGFKEYFAVKANPNPALISILNGWACGKHPQDCLQQCGSAIRTWGPRYADSMRRWRRLDSEVYGTCH